MAEGGPFSTHWSARSPFSRGSKGELKKLRRNITRREILIAVAGAVALLLLFLLSLVSDLKHLEEHQRRRSR